MSIGQTIDDDRFLRDFLAALAIGRDHHDLSIDDVAHRSGISRAVIYGLLAEPRLPRWPTAVALAAATGWRMDLVISPVQRRSRAPAISPGALAGHGIPGRREITRRSRTISTIIRQQVAAAVLQGLARLNWSLRDAARAAHMMPTKPPSLLTSASGPDPATLARLLHPMGLDVMVWYRPWGARGLPVQIKATREAAQRVRRSGRSTLAVLCRMAPEIAGLIQDPDDAAIRAAYETYGSVAAAAEHLQVSISWIVAQMNRIHLRVRMVSKFSRPERRRRDHAIVRAVRAGRTCAELGSRYGISRARVHQVVQKHGINLRALRRQQRLGQSSH